MAEEGIVRDFSAEMLEWLLGCLSEKGMEKPTHEPPELQTAYGRQWADETECVVTDAINTLHKIFDINKAAAGAMTAIWEKVYEIDARYETMFEALRERFVGYMAAVAEIADMIDVNRLREGGGLMDGADFTLRAARLKADMQARKERYERVCMEDAMNLAGVPEMFRVKMAANLREMGYSTEGIIQLLRACKSETDGTALLALALRQYTAIFAIDPATLSESMLLALSDHASILAMGEQYDELAAYLNAITDPPLIPAEGNPFDDELPHMPGVQYGAEYLAIFSAATATSAAGLNVQLSSCIAYIDGGGVVWKEPQDMYKEAAQRVGRVNALVGLLESLRYYNATLKQFEEEYEFETYGGYSSMELSGFSMEGLTYDESTGAYSFGRQYTGNVVDGRFSVTEQFIIEGSEYKSYAFITTDDWDENAETHFSTMEVLNNELRSAQDKFLTGMMFGAAALAACVIPGAPAFLAGTKAIMGAFDALGKLASGGNGSYSDLLDGVKVGALDTGALKRAGIDADSADGKAALGGLQSFLGMLDAHNDYQASVADIGVKMTLADGKYKNSCFGQTIVFSGYDYANHKAQNNYVPAFYGNYKQVYSQMLWEANGLEFLAPKGTNLYGAYGSGSALERWAQDKSYEPFENDPADFVDRIKSMSDTEKLVWFGHDLDVYKQLGIDPPPAALTLNTCDAAELSKAMDEAALALKGIGAVDKDWSMEDVFDQGYADSGVVE